METNVVIRVLVVYVTLVLGLRILGKREFGKLAPIELLTLLLIPEMVSTALTGGNASLIQGLVGAATLFLLVYLTSFTTHLSHRVEATMEGEPTVLAYAGRVSENALNRERVTPEELYSEMRKVGLERLEQVRWAVLETDGRISIVPRSDA